MPRASSSRPAPTVIAIAGSLVVALLFLASAFGLGANSPYHLRMLRLTPATLAIALLPAPATAWIAAVWSHRSPSRGANTIRLLVTILLLLIAVASATLTLLVLFTEPVQRGTIQ
jgi:hypothetical protein